MASPNNPKSSAQLIREHSTARVLVAAQVHPLLTKVRGIRTMTDADAVEAQVQKYR